MVLGRTCSESLTTGPTDEQHDANSDGDPKMGPMTSWVDGVCETNGSQTHYIRTGGSKPSVVLLHGLMGSGATWTPLARALEAGFDVVMPDARGHGRSSAPKPGHGYNDLASDVVALITGLDLMRPVLVGHSMGAMTATIAAGSSDLDLAGLILVDPTFLDAERQQQVWESDVAGQHGEALTRLRSELLAEARARHPHRSAEIVELQVDARLRTHMNTFDVHRPPNPEYRHLIGELELPILLIIGDTPVVSPEIAAELSAINSHVQIEQIPNAGHGLPFDQPEHLARTVVTFLGLYGRPAKVASTERADPNETLKR